MEGWQIKRERFDMSIDSYTTAICFFYLGLFFFFVLAGIVDICHRVRKGPLKHWWGITPCGILYAFFACVSTLSADTAYDDIADPNYARYGGWELSDFIFHDIRTLVIWVLIGLAVYFVSKSRWKFYILAAIGILLTILWMINIITWQPECCMFLPFFV